MSIRQSVRHQLLFSRELLIRSDYRSLMPGDLHRLGHDVIISDDAAELAMAAISSQLGCPGCNRRVCITDYFNWLREAGHYVAPAAGMDYLAELHRVRMELQSGLHLPDLQKWDRVKEITLGFIATWCHDYLGVGLVQIESSPARVGLSTISDAQTHPEPPEIPDERRRSPRFACDGTANLRLPYIGRPVAGRLLKVSCTGCYIETGTPFEQGTRVEIVLQVNGLAFRSMGDVKTVYGHSGMGIEFQDMSAGGRERLQEVIRELGECFVVTCTPKSGPRH